MELYHILSDKRTLIFISVIILVKRAVYQRRIFNSVQHVIHHAEQFLSLIQQVMRPRQHAHHYQYSRSLKQQDYSH